MTSSVYMIERVAKRLGELREQVVFVGGAVLAFLITEEGAPEPRVTDDVDAVVEIASRLDYYDFCKVLRAKGFAEDHSEGAPLCRWVVDGITVDLMPQHESLLGFSNRWYP